jgi:DNA invertase Pin-like site-specific DNA recombinase
VVRAAIYARISSDREGDNLAISRQLADCEQLAERRGWAVVERYVDADISAYSGKLRPEYRRMLEEIEAGLIEAVVVYHADRLHRQPKELEEFMEVCAAAKLTKLATVSGELDLASHDGQLIARITGAVAKKASDDSSRRIRRKHEEIALAGRPSGGGTRPFGFESDHRTVRPSEAVIIRECAERFLAGDSLRSICNDLNMRGVRPVKAEAWSPQTMRRMLSSARISGQRDHHDEIVGAAIWEAIITPAQTQRIRAKLADPTRRTNRSARRYLLTRTLRCGQCQERLVSRPRDDGRRRYVCASGPGASGCGKTTIVADQLEQFIVEAVLHRLDSPGLAASLNGRAIEDPDGVVWQAEIEQAEEQLAELATMFGQREISRQEWLAARPRIEQRLTLAKKRLTALNRTAALTPHIGDATALRERWRDLSLTKQTQIVEAVLDHVVVGPGRRGYNRFDPARLDPVWRA